MGTVTGVDDRYLSDLRGILRGTFYEMTHHDDVCVVRHHRDGVFQRLSLRTAGNLRVSETDDTGTKSVGGSLETQTGTGGGLEEEGSDHFSFQYLSVRMLLKLLCHLYHIENLLTGEVSNGYKIMLFHILCSFRF